MTFSASRISRSFLLLMAALLWLAAPDAHAQSDDKNADLVPKTQVNKDAKTPPIQGAHYPPLRLTPDRPEIVNLDKSAANIVVPNETHVKIRPDTRRTLIIQPRQPGATFFRALDKKGNIIMQRYIYVGAPKKNYVRVHRSCDTDSDSCQKQSMYYCPGRCYNINVQQRGTSTGASGNSGNAGAAGAGVGGE